MPLIRHNCQPAKNRTTQTCLRSGRKRNTPVSNTIIPSWDLHPRPFFPCCPFSFPHLPLLSLFPPLPALPPPSTPAPRIPRGCKPRSVHPPLLLFTPSHRVMPPLFFLLSPCLLREYSRNPQLCPGFSASFCFKLLLCLLLFFLFIFIFLLVFPPLPLKH